MYKNSLNIYFYMLDLIEEKITGTQVAYYIVCKRKLWFFSHYIQM
ncbi:MAG: Dna2/Cas4 domain-containing protein, partial [Candidatus Aenigmatarchaeota archaeon]